MLAVAAALVVPNLGDGSTGPDSAMDPASAAALEDYDAARMPELMDAQARAVLEGSEFDLGPSTFEALDGFGQKIPEKHWDKASALSVSFGTDEHSYTVSISQSRGEAEGDPDGSCRDGLADGNYLECTVQRTDAGDVVIDVLWALTPMNAGHPSGGVATRDELEDIPLEKLSFERWVKVVKSETLVAYVSEEVQATSHDPASAAFVTPVADLVKIGADPMLVMPVPPPGENGCPAWSILGDTASCKDLPSEGRPSSS